MLELGSIYNQHLNNHVTSLVRSKQVFSNLPCPGTRPCGHLAKRLQTSAAGHFSPHNKGFSIVEADFAGSSWNSAAVVRSTRCVTHKPYSFQLTTRWSVLDRCFRSACALRNHPKALVTLLLAASSLTSRVLTLIVSKTSSGSSSRIVIIGRCCRFL